MFDLHDFFRERIAQIKQAVSLSSVMWLKMFSVCHLFHAIPYMCKPLHGQLLLVSGDGVLGLHYVRRGGREFKSGLTYIMIF